MMLSPSAHVPCRELNTLWISTVATITIALWCGVFVTSAFGAPTKLDDIASPSRTSFPLETQPKLFSSAFAAALDKDNGFGNGDGSFLISQPSAINSYGNPIEALKPIDTPDGRKVVNAQGVQFEIPNYASGITEIKRPSDDLLPPFIAPFEQTITSGNAVTATSVEQQLSNPTKTTFSKSNDGKVITNNILTTTGDAITSTIQKDLQQQISSGSNSNFGDSTTSFNKATTPSGVKGGDVRAASDVTGKYTGGFGGSPGVLESGIGPTPNRAIVHATLTTPTPTSGITSALNKPAGTAAVVTKYEGTFGGPPGVLTPFDNIKTG